MAVVVNDGNEKQQPLGINKKNQIQKQKQKHNNNNSRGEGWCRGGAPPRNSSIIFAGALIISRNYPDSHRIPQTEDTEEDIYKNLLSTVFSANWQLHVVERMEEAAPNPSHASSNDAAVVICYQGNVVLMVSSSTKSPHLDEDNCTETTVAAAAVAENMNATTNVPANAMTTTSNTT
eukprot:CAMPEP_0119013462 /NCGR_PEP_ID=MMETSP1176-20130426/8461_1 /TAXON_ID=265551 /ORGANISM="Synedropsis recta cf, Strain CCMP1620" /LENGTH=176 /DNA_ID=CAMNT_0006966553 /DNA_START=126 /DNA_END=658 /DNA_ORIENTATION=+